MNRKYFVSRKEIGGSVGLNLPQWIRQKISELVFVHSSFLPGTLVSGLSDWGRQCRGHHQSPRAMGMASLDFFPQGVDTVRK